MNGPPALPAQGSLAWYAALFSPPEHRPAIEALYGLWEEIRGLPLRLSEPEPARLRLAWWDEELARLGAGDPRHPRARALAPHLAPPPERGAPDPVRLLRELLIAAEEELAGRGCENDDELRLHCFRSAGAPLAVLARALGLPPEPALVAGREAGELVRCTEILARLGPDLARGRLLLPLEHIDRPETLVAGDGTILDAASLGSAVAVTATRAGHAARAARASPAPRFLRVLGELHERLLARARRRLASRVPREPVTLSPWTLLWSAWRAARHSMRQGT